MSDAYVSVAEAAEILGVHPQRVHQRIRDRSLPAQKIGSQWAIQASDVRRLTHTARPGRPLSSKSAWDLLAVAADSQLGAALSASARSRARSRLRNLLLLASEVELEEAAAHLAGALRNRAARRVFIASPRDLPDLQADRRFHRSGISLPESNMSVGDVAEGYLASDDLDAIIDDYLLSPAHPAKANVILHVVPSEAKHPIPAHIADLARSSMAFAADLAEHDGVREKSQALRSLGDLASYAVSLGINVEGTAHG